MKGLHALEGRRADKCGLDRVEPRRRAAMADKVDKSTSLHNMHQFDKGTDKANR